MTRTQHFPLLAFLALIPSLVSAQDPGIKRQSTLRYDLRRVPLELSGQPLRIELPSEFLSRPSSIAIKVTSGSHRIATGLGIFDRSPTIRLFPTAFRALAAEEFLVAKDLVRINPEMRAETGLVLYLEVPENQQLELFSGSLLVAKVIAETDGRLVGTKLVSADVDEQMAVALLASGALQPQVGEPVLRNGRNWVNSATLRHHLVGRLERSRLEPQGALRSAKISIGIDTGGNVLNISIVNGDSEIFERVRKGIASLRFEPFRKAQIPVEVYSEFTVAAGPDGWLSSVLH